MLHGRENLQDGQIDIQEKPLPEGPQVSTAGVHKLISQLRSEKQQVQIQYFLKQ